jgi:ABC-type Fe3+-citrate transport system substrate-binding protein
LVVGNGAYSSVPPLTNPPNDAADMCAALRQIGFKTLCYTNVRDRAELDAQFTEYVEPQVSIESVLAHDPQVIVSTDDTVADHSALWRRWPQLTAVRAGTIYTIPSDTVARSTPRLVEGVATVCARLADARRRLDASAPQRAR